MDKALRVTILYSHLMDGERMNKDAFCMEYGISTRTFDRDIEIIRNALSELYSAREVVYDRKTNEYYTIIKEQE
jgi:predicted DNA-binding transcriptional regulator YafY